jgi:hypothetical protein
MARRPFGVGIHFYISKLEDCSGAEVYAESAHVQDLTSIEVIATVVYDGSHLILSRCATVVSHKRIDVTLNEFGDVDSCDRPLGWVTYSKPDGTEHHYLLGTFFDILLRGFSLLSSHNPSHCLQTRSSRRPEFIDSITASRSFWIRRRRLTIVMG